MICLWVNGIGVKVHFVSEYRVKFVIPGVIRDFSSKALLLLEELCGGALQLRLV